MQISQFENTNTMPDTRMQCPKYNNLYLKKLKDQIYDNDSVFTSFQKRKKVDFNLKQLQLVKQQICLNERKRPAVPSRVKILART